MSRAGRVWVAVLMAFAVAGMPLLTCDCREMASRPSQDAHCGSESGAATLVAGCDCPCMLSAPETLAALANPWSMAPAAQTDTGLAPGPLAFLATAPALRTVASPTRSSPRVLRI